MKKLIAIIAIAALVACDADHSPKVQHQWDPAPTAPEETATAPTPSTPQQINTHNDTSPWVWGLMGYMAGRMMSDSGSRTENHYHYYTNEPNASSRGAAVASAPSTPTPKPAASQSAVRASEPSSYSSSKPSSYSSSSSSRSYSSSSSSRSYSSSSRSSYGGRR